jgi:CubicO group peptidase (beta-lactamase class C family)
MRSRPCLQITRREVLASAVALSASTLPALTSRAASEDPFHDPGFSVLRPRPVLVKELRPVARQAQETPRVVKGVAVTGLPESVPELDDRIIDVMTASGIPGVSLALAKDNRLLVARGYGRASPVGNVVVEPTMPSTIMSVSKTVTVMAALTLVRDKRLRLDDPAFRILGDMPLLAPGQSADSRLSKVEVRHLMSHTSGLFNVVEMLNDPAYFDMLARRGAIRLLHGRIGQNDLVRIGMKVPLLFEPGQKYAYSGQGIQVLGRIVEKVSGLRLDRYIQQALFDPLGIRSYYVGSYLDDAQYAQLMRPNREQLYTMSPAVYDKSSNRHHPLERRAEYVSWGQADACGWGSLSALDLLRYVAAVPSIVGSDLWRDMLERPLVINDAGQSAPAPMGLGFVITQKGPNKGIFHDGVWPGERSFAGLRGDGTCFALLLNSDDGPRVAQILAAATQLLDRLNQLTLSPPEWQDYGYRG